jgi:hypothetical protein
MTGTVTELLARCRDAGLSLMVEGDALVVDYERVPPRDLVEELRRNKPRIIAALMPPVTVIAPARWVQAARAAGETPFERPCPERRGLVQRKGGALLHFCVECAYGYGCAEDNPGRWYCREHRPAERELRNAVPREALHAKARRD